MTGWTLKFDEIHMADDYISAQTSVILKIDSRNAKQQITSASIRAELSWWHSSPRTVLLLLYKKPNAFLSLIIQILGLYGKLLLSEVIYDAYMLNNTWKERSNFQLLSAVHNQKCENYYTFYGHTQLTIRQLAVYTWAERTSADARNAVGTNKIFIIQKPVVTPSSSVTQIHQHILSTVIHS